MEKKKKKKKGALEIHHQDGCGDNQFIVLKMAV